MSVDFSRVAFYTWEQKQRRASDCLFPGRIVTVQFWTEQQENVCEKVCLFSALNSHSAAKSISRKVKSIMSNGTNTSFGSLKQINAGVLNVGYVEAGKSDGPAVMLLHGWPYDIHSYVDVAPRLSQAGYRVIVPYLRGYGPTRFLSRETLRNGQQSVVALDIIALMDARSRRRAEI